MAQNNEKADLPLKATLTTLEFHSGAILTKYALQGEDVPVSLTKDTQLADIAWVAPEAKAYLEKVEQKYSELRAGGGNRKTRATAFDLKNLAGRHPLALGRLLDIMAEPYSLPLPSTFPVSDVSHMALTSLFKKKDRHNLSNLDAVLHRFLNHPPQWHFEMAEQIERVAAYLDLKDAVLDFMWGNTEGTPRKEDALSPSPHRLWTKAWAIRQEFRSNLYKNFRPMNKPPDFVLGIVLHRLAGYLKALTGKPGGSTFITAMIQTAPYTPHYRQYKSATLKDIQNRLQKPPLLRFCS